MAYSTTLRDALDPAVMTLPGVSARAMFGAHCYMVDGKMFLILLGDSLILKPAAADEDTLRDGFGAVAWSHRPGQTFGRFMEVGAGACADTGRMIPFIQDACEARRRERK
ncbi:MAG: TfoX/Sxy family protein [Chloroflexi bacterium]|nr:TfoX/Sxy family protein [Chloroflexota bacterium]